MKCTHTHTHPHPIHTNTALKVNYNTPPVAKLYTVLNDNEIDQAMRCNQLMTWEQTVGADGGNRRWQQTVGAGDGSRLWEQTVELDGGSRR